MINSRSVASDESLGAVRPRPYQPAPEPLRRPTTSLLLTTTTPPAEAPPREIARADARSGPIVYLAATLPGRSQTFVYQEIHALRAAGVRVLPVSVRRNLMMARVEAELGHVHALLGNRVVARAMATAARRPLGSARAMARVLTARYPSRRERARSAWHAVIGLALAGYARREGARYIHAHHANLATTVAMVASGASGIPFGFTAHGSDVHVSPALVPEKIAGAARVVAASDSVRGRLDELAPGSAERVEVVRCGVPLDRFRVGLDRPPSAALRLLHVGRLIEAKDQVTLVRAVAAARAAGAEVELRIVGDGPERAAVEEEIAAQDASSAVRLLGALPNDELPALYAWADAFVMSSRREGLPVVLAEAMAAGLPVVSTGVSGIPELVRDGVEGLLVPPGDPERLGAAIVRIADPALRARLARAGVERAEVHDIDRAAARLVEVFPVPGPAPSAADGGFQSPLPLTVIVRAPEGHDPAGLRRSLDSVAAQRPRPAAGVVVASGGAASAAAGVSEAWVALLECGDELFPHALAALWNARRDGRAVAGPVLSVREGRVLGEVSPGRRASGILAPRALLAAPGPLRGDVLRAPAVARTATRSGRARRRAARLAADGVASIALMPGARRQAGLAVSQVPERPLVDLSAASRPVAWARLAAAPTRAAFVGSAAEALLARALGIRPLWADRPESQTRGSRRWRGAA